MDAQGSARGLVPPTFFLLFRSRAKQTFSRNGNGQTVPSELRPYRAVHRNRKKYRDGQISFTVRLPTVPSSYRSISPALRRPRFSSFIFIRVIDCLVGAKSSSSRRVNQMKGAEPRAERRDRINGDDERSISRANFTSSSKSRRSFRLCESWMFSIVDLLFAGQETKGTERLSPLVEFRMARRMALQVNRDKRFMWKVTGREPG